MQSWAIMPLTHCKVFWFDKNSLFVTIIKESTTLMIAVAKIDNAKFKRKVVPGDVLVLKLTITQPIRRSIVCMHGEAYVGDTLACEADMVAQVIKNKE